MIRKGTERIGEGFEVGVLGGEHGDESEHQRMQDACECANE
jgi:hypothetical protein